MSDDFQFDLNEPRRRTSKAQAIMELQRVSQACPGPLTTVAFKKSHPRISLDTIIRLFGTFRAACEAAGLNTENMKRDFTDEQLVAFFETLCRDRAARGLAARPAITDFRRYREEHGTGVSYNSFKRRFGDYGAFLSNYADYHGKKITRAELIRRAKDHKKPKRGPISDKVRAETLKKFGSRCTACGRDATSLTEGEWLEIDHIVPVSKGGTSEPANLTVKCSRCNRGKSDRFNG